MIHTPERPLISTARFELDVVADQLIGLWPRDDAAGDACHGWIVVERREQTVQPFEEARPALAARAANDMSRDIARAEINRVNAAIKQNKPANAGAFAALATGRLTSNDSGFVGKNDAVGTLGFNQPLSQWIFAAKQGDISDPIGTSKGIAIAYVEETRSSGVSMCP